MKLTLAALLCLASCTRAELRSEPASCCVSSASAKGDGAVAEDTPEAAWDRLLAAMRGGDEPAIARYTTPAGLASLEKRVIDEPRKVAFARWGKGWAAWEVRWKKKTATEAEASLGPEVKEHGLSFVKVDGSWKLNRWMPGE